jgi:hypothetical protein
MVMGEVWRSVNQRSRYSTLLNFFVDCVLIAMRTKLAQFQPIGGVAAVLRCGVTRNPRRSFVEIRAALGAF